MKHLLLGALLSFSSVAIGAANPTLFAIYKDNSYDPISVTGQNVTVTLTPREKYKETIDTSKNFPFVVIFSKGNIPECSVGISSSDFISGCETVYAQIVYGNDGCGKIVACREPK